MKQNGLCILISPAKKMRIDDGLPADGLPVFLEQSEQILAAMRALTDAQLQRLWGCNDRIAARSLEQLAAMRPYEASTPAILAYDGIQYQYMSPGVLDRDALAYLGQTLCILSGFYGVLRAFDAVSPYRLELQARLAVGAHRDLYAFWGDRPAQWLADQTDLVVNLASKEYSAPVQTRLPASVRFVSCVFAERVAGKLIEKGTRCKMARGRMVRWMAERQIGSVEQLRAFDELGYRFDAAASQSHRLVFVKGSD